MKIISIIASPRKNGNCANIVKMMTEKIIEEDSENIVYFIDDMNIKPCQGCMSCRNPNIPSKCVIMDDFRMIMDQFDENGDADALIFAAPNYFGEINAQGHIFMDRFYSMTKSTPNQIKEDKKAAVIFTYGASDGYYDDYIAKRSHLFESIGFKLAGVLSVGENMPTKTTGDIKIKAQKLASKLL